MEVREGAATLALQNVVASDGACSWTYLTLKVWRPGSKMAFKSLRRVQSV